MFVWRYYTLWLKDKDENKNGKKNKVFIEIEKNKFHLITLFGLERKSIQELVSDVFYNCCMHMMLRVSHGKNKENKECKGLSMSIIIKHLLYFMQIKIHKALSYTITMT